MYYTINTTEYSVEQKANLVLPYRIIETSRTFDREDKAIAYAIKKAFEFHKHRKDIEYLIWDEKGEVIKKTIAPTRVFRYEREEQTGRWDLDLVYDESKVGKWTNLDKRIFFETEEEAVAMEVLSIRNHLESR